MSYFIDPPSPFASRNDWEQFKLEIEALLAKDPQSEELLEALDQAQEAVNL